MHTPMTTSASFSALEADAMTGCGAGAMSTRGWSRDEKCTIIDKKTEPRRRWVIKMWPKRFGDSRFHQTKLRSGTFKYHLLPSLSSSTRAALPRTPGRCQGLTGDGRLLVGSAPILSFPKRGHGSCIHPGDFVSSQDDYELCDLQPGLQLPGCR